MRPLLLVSSLTFAALAMIALLPERGGAQDKGQQGLPNLKPPPAAPVKPYKPLAITLPTPYDDASFAAFRKQLAEVAQKKDRAALGKLVVGQGFFWLQDKDVADKHKSGLDNLARAIDLDAKDGSGWDTLAAYAEEPTAMPAFERQGVICAPANPAIDPKGFQTLIESTKTEPPEWGYPTKDGIEVRDAAQPNAPVIDKLGLALVRVLPDSAPPDDANQPAFLHVATPSGKAGFVPADAIAGLGGDEICYSKDANGWKIAGYYGGAGQ